MPKRRSRLEIVYDILKSAIKPIKPTPLMSRAGIRHISFRVYGPLLIEKGLIEKVPFVRRGYKGGLRRQSKQTSHLYVTTKKGKEFITLFDQGEDVSQFV